MEYAVGLAEPVGHANVSALGGAAERISLDLIDCQLSTEAARDRLHQLGEDFLRVVRLRPGYESGVPGDIRHDQEAVHRRDGTSVTRGRIALRAFEAEPEACPASAVDGTFERD